MRRRFPLASSASRAAITSAAHCVVEGLESRRLLSVTIKPTTDALGNPGLKITGNGSKDTVVIADDQVNGTIDITANGKTTHYTGIVSFHVDMGGGNDKLEYDLITAGGPTEGRTLHLDGDAGDDRVVFTSIYDEEAASSVVANGAPAGLAELDVELIGGTGNDTILADVNYLSDINVTFDVEAGSGIDTVGISLGALSAGDAVEAPTLFLNVDLGSGKNALNIEVGEQEVGTVVAINVKGGDSTGTNVDRVNIDVGPSVTGAVSLDVNLGAGDDTLSVDGEISTGGGEPTTTEFNLNGGDGKDKMSLTLDGVYGDGFSFTNLQVKGGNGDDTLTGDLSHIFVAEGGELTVAVDGQNGADTINGSFAFTADLSAIVAPSAPQSLLAAAVTGVLTPGTIDISLRGGQQNDRFNVFAATEEEVLDSGGPILVDGQSGTDKIKFLSGADKTLFTVKNVEQVLP
jgi:hypothetical protein